MRSSSTLAFSVVGLLLSAVTLTGADLEVLKTEQPAITLDGKLDEPVWSQAPAAGDFSRFANIPHAEPPQATTFRILADANAIYLGVKCLENNMAGLRAHVTLADNPDLAWNDDLLEIFLCPTGRSDSYYQFVATAGGGLWSQYWKEKGLIKPDFFRPYWQSAVHQGADFWSIEIKIPLAAFYLTPADQFRTEWLVNVGRQRGAASQDCSTWSKLQRGFHETDLFRKVAGFPLKRVGMDLFIRSVVPKVETADEVACVGKVFVIVESSVAAQGDYHLKIKVAGKEYRQDITLRGEPLTVSMDAVAFPRSGKLWAAAELTNPQGQLVMARYYPLLIEYDALSWEMLKPMYKRSFFPGQDATQVSGGVRLNLPQPLLRKVNAEIRVKPDGLPEQKLSAKPVKGRIGFHFDLKSDQYARAEISIVVKADGRVLPNFCGSITIRNLPPKPGLDSLWVENGRLMVNGKPRFLLSFFAPEWIVGASYRAQFPRPQDKCPQVDVKSLELPNLEMNRLVANIEQEEGRLDIKPRAELFEAIRKKVEQHRDKTDFWFYYLEDEPECRQLSPVYLKHLYDYVTELDPYHPVYIISRAPATYANCADVLSTHTYTGPIVDEDGKYKLDVPVKSVRADGKPLLAAQRPDVLWNYSPQLFSYRMSGSTSAEYARFDDSQATVWSAIANGCMGINAYTYSGLMASVDLDHGFRFLYESIRHLEPYLLAPNRLPVKAENEGDAVDVMLKEFAGSHLLVLVNVMPEPTTAVVSARALRRYRALYRYREASQVALRSSRFTMELAPWQTVILTSKKLDDNLSTVAALRAGMDGEKNAFVNRKNLLADHRRKVEIATSPMSFSYYTGSAVNAVLFDGNLVNPAFFAEPKDYDQPGWFEVSFPEGSPAFSRLALHHANCTNAKVQIWQKGGWRPLVEKSRKDEPFLTQIDFGEPCSTVKLRINFDKLERQRGNFWEIYELELLE